MVQVLQISDKVTLYDLRVNFGLQPSLDPQFFVEWQDNLPQLSDATRHALDRVKHNFEAMTERSLLSENIVKLAIVSPLLDVVDLYGGDYQIRDETSVEISVEAQPDITYRGRIDLLVIQEQLWLVIIETKRLGFSLELALPQTLAYMLANPHPTQPVFGLLTNGSEFRFLKLVKLPSPQYGISKIFSIRDPGNDLYLVTAILQKITTVLNLNIETKE